MKYLDDIEIWLKKLNSCDPSEVLSGNDLTEWNLMSWEEREEKLTAFTETYS